jgi:hypothetical protein
MWSDTLYTPGAHCISGQMVHVEKMKCLCSAQQPGSSEATEQRTDNQIRALSSGGSQGYGLHVPSHKCWALSQPHNLEGKR